MFRSLPAKMGHLFKIKWKRWGSEANIDHLFQNKMKEVWLGRLSKLSKLSEASKSSKVSRPNEWSKPVSILQSSRSSNSPEIAVVFSSGFYSGSIFHVLRRLYKIIKGAKHGRGGLRSNPDTFSCSQVASLLGVFFQVFRSLRKIKRASRSLLNQVFKLGSFLAHVSILREYY